MRVRFLKTVQHQSEGRNKGPIYNEGSEHEFPEPFAQKWLRRGVAVVVEPSPAPVRKATPPSSDK